MRGEVLSELNSGALGYFRQLDYFSIQIEEYKCMINKLPADEEIHKRAFIAPDCQK
jgi:hypothetical protein